MVQGSGHLAVLGGSTTLSEEPVFSDESEGKLERSGVDASQRLSFLLCRKTFRGKPRSERYSGNPTVADRRGACGNMDVIRRCAHRSSIPTRDERGAYGNVSYGGTRHPLHTPKGCRTETLCLRLRAPYFYPTSGACLSRGNSGTWESHLSPCPHARIGGPDDQKPWRGRGLPPDHEPVRDTTNVRKQARYREASDERSDPRWVGRQS